MKTELKASRCRQRLDEIKGIRYDIMCAISYSRSALETLRTALRDLDELILRAKARKPRRRVQP